MKQVYQQCSDPLLGDTVVYIDDTVETDGQPNLDATVETVEGMKRIDVTGSGFIDFNQVPQLSKIRVFRVPGWNNVLGWRAELVGLVQDATPNAVSLGIYSSPGATGYLYTPGAFLWDDENQVWHIDCPAGQEPGDADIHFGVLYGSAPVSSFTLRQGLDDVTFVAGGPW